MSLSDPLSVTISGTTTPLPRISTGANKSDYVAADGLIKITASHAYGKRTRRVFRLDHSKIGPDPWDPSKVAKVSMSNYIVFDVPLSGYTLAEAQAVYTGFKTLYTASSDALIVKLLGGEN